MGTICFREATSDDATAIGTIHVASWRETYTGLLPQQLLDDLSADARAAMWRTVLKNPVSLGGASVFVAETEGEIIAFAACGAQRDEALRNLGFESEIGAIYVRRMHQRAGAGHSLMSMMARKLMDANQKSAALWVLRENATARSFYEHLGGTLIAERVEDFRGNVLTEVAYGWRDLSVLSRLS